VANRLTAEARPAKQARLRRGQLVAAVAAIVVLAAGTVVALLAARSSGPSVSQQNRTIDVTDGPQRDQHVRIPTRLFVPATASAARPAPAVILAHGFGGSLEESQGDALALARHGYVVLTYSARGFGGATGAIGLDSPDYDVVDVRALVDLLAARPDVLHDGPGDPRVGISGPSYGGGISLLAAAYDHRIDAVAASITWNSLVSTFSPQAADNADVGVFKSGWASLFFGLGSTTLGGGAGGASGGAAPGRPSTGGAADPVCPGFVPEVCRAYADAQAAGRLTPSGQATLERSSVSSVIGRLRVPTLLMQGQNDTLFPLAEARTTADDLRQAGVPTKEVWLAGGHDGGFDSETARVRSLTGTWFDRWLRRDARVDTGPGFEASRVAGSTIRTDPASIGRRTTTVPLTGTKVAVNPPGGQPASLSGFPGLGAVSALAPQLSADLPGQAATFDGPVLARPLELLGTPTATVKVSSTSGEAVLFAKLLDVSADGITTLPYAQVVPLRVSGLPTSGAGRTVTVTLPALTHRFAIGHHVRLALASTDLAYAGSRTPALYTVTGTSAGLTLPVSPVPRGGGLAPLALAGLGLLVLLGVGALVALLRSSRVRRDAVVARAAADGVASRARPVEIRGLTKAYDGRTVVEDLDLTVEHGQVVGLLGPNGAGKTTTLRMLLGLVLPDGGTSSLFGTTVRPGSPALARVGTFVEGTGFVPQSTGRQNLRDFWEMGGTSWDDAHWEEALEVAGLGDAVDRPVRTYSQGMRQRLALAQALLGRPNLVILDEPTNGLDPPQIVEVRRVIRELAKRGTTVLLSSHQLSEVEQVCTHVVVMAKGRLVTTGTVAEVIGADRAVHVELPTDQIGSAAAIARDVRGVTAVEPDSTGMVVELDDAAGADRAELIARLVKAGVRVTGVTPRRALEQAFLDLVSPGGDASTMGVEAVAAPASSPEPAGVGQ
jgi:ABC-2 type transport system ATP-binding protein